MYKQWNRAGLVGVITHKVKEQGCWWRCCRNSLGGTWWPNSQFILAHFWYCVKVVWDLNYIYSHNPKCYNILNECNYRVMSAFRMAKNDLTLVLKSNLAPAEVCSMLIQIHRVTVISNKFKVQKSRT